ncbi:MAG: T9SS type A sorting domain-containing protein, partial [Prevotella sp.]|nr:T9SS type A sorting domain-containing protein [Prevotella sp.]
YVDDVLITNPSIINRNQTIEIYTLSSGLPYNKLITVTIPKTAIPAQNGFELKEDIVWSFTTEEDPTAIQAATVQPTVYPSVTTGKVTVKSAGKATVRVTSVLGKVLSVGIINGELTLDLSGYPAGTYLVSVGNSVYKVIKK